MVAVPSPEGDSSQFDGITQRLRAGLIKYRRFATGAYASLGRGGGASRKAGSLRRRSGQALPACGGSE